MKVLSYYKLQQHTLVYSIPTFFTIHFSLLVNFIYLYSFISSLTVVFRENSFEGYRRSYRSEPEGELTKYVIEPLARRFAQGGAAAAI